MKMPNSPTRHGTQPPAINSPWGYMRDTFAAIQIPRSISIRPLPAFSDFAIHFIITVPPTISNSFQKS